ncbi:S41 family peptidase [Candidatus Gottesmanbacteria bacterium]|nr:S41 family peptidase [Candidatus Gottesmanbacteria bacterium]
MSLKTIRNFILILALTLLVGGIGYNLGKREVAVSWKNFTPQVSVTNLTPPVTSSIDFSLFWDVWDRLAKNYIDKKALDPQKMVWGAISGMVQSLGDPYTVFLTPTQQKETKEELGGQFEGIGAQLGIKDKKIVVVAPLKGTPAEKAGVKAGDWIVKVDGKDIANWTLPEAVSKIRGQRGTKVVLTIIHEGEEKPVEIGIVRDTILVKSVEWSREARSGFVGEVAYLKLSRFGDQTSSEWEKAVGEIVLAYQKGEVKGLVLDLRNNPGGYLSGAVYIVAEFLPVGTLAVQQEQASGVRQTYSVDRQGKLLDIPMTILINKGSASASEIVAGALRDYGRAKLVGETSFGKGSIQEAQELSGGAGLHITTAKWLLPKGEWINGAGIKPDFEVKMDEKDATKDTQLEKALDLL